MTTPLEPPAAVAAADLTLIMEDAQSTSRSPVTLTSQVYDWGADLWRAELRFARRADAAGGAVRAFLAELRGQAESFWLGDPAAATPQGTQSADFVLASAAAAGDRTLAVTMGAGATLLAGDYVQLGTSLHLVLADVTADGAGAATLSIWPRVRSAQGGGATVKSTNARGTWRLDESSRAFAVQRPRFAAPRRLRLVEAI